MRSRGPKIAAGLLWKLFRKRSHGKLLINEGLMDETSLLANLQDSEKGIYTVYIQLPAHRLAVT